MSKHEWAVVVHLRGSRPAVFHGGRCIVKSMKERRLSWEHCQKVAEFITTGGVA